MTLSQMSTKNAISFNKSTPAAWQSPAPALPGHEALNSMELCHQRLEKAREEGASCGKAAQDPSQQDGKSAGESPVRHPHSAGTPARDTRPQPRPGWPGLGQPGQWEVSLPWLWVGPKVSPSPTPCSHTHFSQEAPGEMERGYS